MERSEKIILSVAGAIFAILLIVVIVVAVRNRSVGTEQQQEHHQAQFVAPAFDEAAVDGAPQIDDPEDKMMYRQINMMNKLYVGMCGALYLDENNEVDAYFTSADFNEAWVRLIIYSTDGKEIGSTGVLKPGQYVQKVTLTDIPEGDVEVVLKVVSYEPDTYYSAGTGSATASLYVQ